MFQRFFSKKGADCNGVQNIIRKHTKKFIKISESNNETFPKKERKSVERNKCKT
jgi:hypothetical protein